MSPPRSRAPLPSSPRPSNRPISPSSKTTSDANSLLQQIAATNGAISTAQNLGQSTNSDQDQLSDLLSQLSAIVGYNTVNSSDGLTLTTSNGTPLVVGSTAYALTNELECQRLQ